MNDHNDPGCMKCDGCYGSRHCQCSRDYTRHLALWMWERICAGVRSLNVGEWLAVAMVIVAALAWAWGQ